jgi:hypothetical protein
MRFGIPSRMFLAAILLAYGFTSPRAQSQSQDSSTSVADAAKRARDQKQNAASKAKVITDDDVDAKKVKPGDEGLTVSAPRLDTEGPSAQAVAAQEAADVRKEESPADDAVKKSDSAKIERLKEELARAEEDLKLSQRELSLQQDTVYSKPDYQHDTAGKATLDAMQQQIGDRQQRVEQLKTQIAAMEELQSKKTGTPPAADKPAAPPQS